MRAAAVGALFAVVLVVLSVISVLRFSAANLATDAILQSIMSVQDVRWFYWGQNRFASVVPALLSPIADPVINLFAVQLVNALAFYGLLLLVSSIAAPVLTGRRGWRSVLVVFLVCAAAVPLVIRPLPIYFMALDAQPYALSWLCGLGSFLLWRKGVWGASAGAVLAWLAVGLNPSVVLGVGLLSAGQMLRTRQWIRWPAFGLLWLAGLASWLVIAARFPPVPGPYGVGDPSYFSFRLGLLADGASTSVGGMVDAFRPIPTMLLAVLGVIGLVVLPSRVRTAVLVRTALLAAFGIVYWVLFTGNTWVADNGWGIRYFFPVVMIILIALCAPIAGALLTVSANDTASVAVAATACALSCIGSQTAPAQAPVLAEVAPTADFARDAGIHYVAGNYWYAWPVVDHLLDEGRDAVFGATLRSDGDATAYRKPFERDLAAGRPPQALCINDSTDSCVTFLNYWTEPGWSTDTVATCPAPPPPGSTAGTCVVLEFDSPRG